jgi:SAM-dependent methyltransferase
MAEYNEETDEFYTDLFTKNPIFATRYPNFDEACRWAKICCFLSQIPDPERRGVTQTLRLLDVGCGRGWLTNLANVYGQCDGVEPSKGAVEVAQGLFPKLTFYTGTARDLLQTQDFKPYDVIITSEVIEHLTDKDGFIADLSKCLVPNGHVIITTPRGEKFQRFTNPLLGRPKTTSDLQPIEDWISEKELRLLFEGHQFTPMGHDRAYIPMARMSFLQLLCALPYKAPIISRTLGILGLSWVHKGMEHLAGIYQVWWFQKTC